MSSTQIEKISVNFLRSTLQNDLAPLAKWAHFRVV